MNEAIVQERLAALERAVNQSRPVGEFLTTVQKDANLAGPDAELALVSEMPDVTEERLDLIRAAPQEAI